MKAILISIKPKWVAKILNGEKTIEIRKTMPKCDLPIDVYIYCTKEKEKCCFVDYRPCGNSGYLTTKLDCMGEELNGKVVAKFTLNRVDEHHVLPNERILPFNWNVEQKLEQLCLTKEEVMAYGKGQDYQAFLWHIFNLEIFNKPKELSEFKIKGFERIKVMGSPYGDLDSVAYHYEKKPILKSLTKAPQSWCYVEVEIDE